MTLLAPSAVWSYSVAVCSKPGVRFKNPRSLYSICWRVLPDTMFKAANMSSTLVSKCTLDYPPHCLG